MKRNLLCVGLSLFFIAHQAIAQNVGINATGAAPHTSAILDVSSTTKGVLFPRMTTAQRNAIASPAEGLMVYNTDCKDINFYNGTLGLVCCSLARRRFLLQVLQARSLRLIGLMFPELQHILLMYQPILLFLVLLLII